ncbi:MAG: YdbH domain-containing protein [Croceibacterium sp.]
MADEAENDTTAETAVRRRSFWRRWILLPLLLILGLAFLAFWIQRKDIADDVIGSYLRSRHVQATYHIDHVGGTRQVLTNIVIGDPRRPDLTIERAEVVVRYRLGFPGIARLILTRPRLYGTYHAGKLSFGALDTLLATGKKQPFALPDYALDLADGRALLDTDYGPVGIKAEGKGNLRGGFIGVLAATAPKLLVAGCKLDGATAYGKIGIDAQRPTFSGPMRLQALDCGSGSARLAQSAVSVDLRLDRDLAGGDGKLSGSSHSVRYAGVLATSVGLSGNASLRSGELTASYKLAGSGLSQAQLQLAKLSASGSIHASRGFGSLRIETDFNGQGFRPGTAFDETLARAAGSTRGTPFEPLLSKLRTALAREATGSTFSGQASLRKTGSVTSLIVPQAALTGGSGERVLSLSRFQFGGGGGGLPRLSGNFATGGRDLPQIEGRVEQNGSDGFTAQLAMAAYQTAGASVAVPSLAIVSKGDRIGFAGRTIVSGDLPGGHADGLLLPVSGYWSPAAGLAMWRQCTAVTFDALRFANRTLERHGLTICPAKGVPILRYGSAGLHVAAGVPSLDLTGRLGSTPIAIRSGPVGIAYPGTVAARQLLVTLGPRDTASTFSVSNLTAQIGKTIDGRFGGTDVKLFSVPMDIVEAGGAWSYAKGKLAIGDGAFRLVDRQKPARFEPLTAKGATLTLENNLVTAQARLREPKSDAVVTAVDIRHDLSTGRGHADLAVDGLTFGPHLQPQQLTPLAFGVIANVAGTVRGTGHIAWDDKGVTSTGSFSSDALDFAAAFGPVKGASGTIVFTDLVGLTTAPDQVIKVASINPGIEVTGGEVSIQLKNAQVLTVNRGTWPFMGGTLTMRPVTLNLGVSEQRSYVLEIRGLEAAQFVERMQLENLSATGTFDGEIPLIFDVDGNGRIEGGHLISRGSGNVSYVGALTYKDLSTMANMAFDALRSLDYHKMDITVEGPLTGEIITHVRFDGVSQGAGAKKNFITRSIGKLPFRFVVNITAPFYQLITNIKSMYDPTMVRNPQDLASEGKLVDENGNLVPAGRIPSTPATPKPTPDEATIQRRESENKP